MPSFLPTPRRRLLAAVFVLPALLAGGTAVTGAVMDGGPRTASPAATPRTTSAGRAPTSRLIGGPGPRRPFSPWACRSLALPGAGAATVVRDAGHGGREPGATAPDGTSEAELTLAVVRAAVPRLLAGGHGVLLTRTGRAAVARPRASDLDGELLTPAGVKRELEARNRCANLGRGSVLVSVHLNSAADPSVRGVQTLYNPRRRYAEANRRLASAVHSSLLGGLRASGWPTDDQGLITDQRTGAPALTAEGRRYGQLLQLGPAWPPWFRTPSRMPAAVVEVAFLTSPDELERLSDPEGQQTVADALAEGIGTFLTGRAGAGGPPP